MAEVAAVVALVCDPAGQYCSVSQAEVVGRPVPASGLGESFMYASGAERPVGEPPVVVIGRRDGGDRWSGSCRNSRRSSVVPNAGVHYAAVPSPR